MKYLKHWTNKIIKNIEKKYFLLSETCKKSVNILFSVEAFII